MAKTGLFPFWPPEGADVEVDFFEAGEPPLLLELLLKSLLKKEFFLSKLFELEPLLTTLDCADAVEEVVVVGPPCKNLTHFISDMYYLFHMYKGSLPNTTFVSANFITVVFGLFPSLLRFLGDFWAKNCSNEALLFYQIEPYKNGSF